MKTSLFPAVVEARKAAHGQLGFYRSMMAESPAVSVATKASKSGSRHGTGKKSKAKAAK